MSLPNQNSNDEEARRREAEADAMRQKVLLVLLEPTARQRLANVMIVKPELAGAVENYLINAAQTGRLNRALTDDELKQILLNLQAPKKDFKINRI